MKILEYKGYNAIVRRSHEDNIWFGKIYFIDDLVTFEAETPRKVKKAFKDAVDDYLEFCAEHNREASKPTLHIRRKYGKYYNLT